MTEQPFALMDDTDNFVVKFGTAGIFGLGFPAGRSVAVFQFKLHLTFLGAPIVGSNRTLSLRRYTTITSAANNI